MENEDDLNIDEFSQEPPENDYNYKEEFYEYEKHIMDVRIIVKDLESAETLIKAVNNMDLKENYNMEVTSIIPTTNVEIAKKATIDSDIILIAIDLNPEGKDLFLNYYKQLKTNYNYIEYLIFENSTNLEITDSTQIENEIHNSIIRAALTSILSSKDISKIQKELYTLKEDYKKKLNSNEQLTLENEKAINQAKELTSYNEDLKDQIRTLQSNIDELKSNYSNFKSQFANIYTKELLEVFNIKELWQETFNEILNDDSNIILATNNFKPLNIIVGQGFIAAKTKDEAIDWLKIIRTTLIFLDNDQGKLETEINQQSNNPNNFNNINNQQSNNQEENNNHDYEVPNSFQNFWD